MAVVSVAEWSASRRDDGSVAASWWRAMLAFFYYGAVGTLSQKSGRLPPATVESSLLGKFRIFGHNVYLGGSRTHIYHLKDIASQTVNGWTNQAICE